MGDIQLDSSKTDSLENLYNNYYTRMSSSISKGKVSNSLKSSSYYEKQVSIFMPSKNCEVSSNEMIITDKVPSL
jgi:hypothetical protein